MKRVLVCHEIDVKEIVDIWLSQSPMKRVLVCHNVLVVTFKPARQVAIPYEAGLGLSRDGSYLNGRRDLCRNPL